jgi:hypothetical protein
MHTTILVVANQTAASDKLLTTLQQRASRSPIRVEFIVPPDGRGDAKREDAERRLNDGLERLRGAGIEATGQVGNSDALTAVTDTYDPKRHDEILVSTLPASISHWMGIDLPARIARRTNALVTQVAAPESVAAPNAYARS